MLSLIRILGIALAVLVFAEQSHAALIKNAKAKTSGTAVVTTNTKGQRQIAITIDPGLVTAFRLDVAYQSDFVTPMLFDGIHSALPQDAIEFIPPYGGAIGGGATILPNGGASTRDGIVSNVEGAIITSPGFAPAPLPNAPDGGTNLFTLFFIDLAPTVDKTFTILGVDAKGIDPDLAPFISDNFLDVVIDDPNDPQNGQTVRFLGDEIEAAQIFVPGIAKVDGSVPLPAGLWAGLIGAGLTAIVRHKRRQPMIDK